MPEKPVTQTIYLHIGTQKTGTTTLQMTGKHNRTKLAERGVLYPSSPGEINHIGLALFASGGLRCMDLARQAGLRGQADIDAYQEKLPSRLRTEIAHAGMPKVWLSNEHLSSRLRTPQQLTHLADLLRGLAEEVQVIVYLRHQPEFYLSTYSMVIKVGGEKESRLPRTARTHYYNYEQMLSLWAAAFGESAIRVRVFERAALKHGDVVDDMFDLLGIGRDGLRIPPDQNPSLDAASLQFLRLFRRHVPSLADGGPNPDYADIVRALEALPPGPKYTVPAATMRELADMFAPSNASVARRFLGRADGKLFTPAAYDDGPGSAPITAEQAVEIAAHLWRWKQSQVTELRAGRRRSKTEDAS